MCKAGLAIAVVLASVGVGCGATTTRGGSPGAPAPTLTSASATFMTRDDGKDEDSAVAMQILDDTGRLSAEATVADLEFDDQSVSPPVTLSIVRALPAGGLNDARLRLRLTPDGNDTWTFDLRLMLGLSDGTQRTYFWSGLRLEENAPERALPLSSGRLP